MSRRLALLILDPSRWNDQMAYIGERGNIVNWSGDRPWMSVTEEQVPRFETEGINVVFPVNQDQIHTPAVIFQPSAETPTPPSAFAASEPDGNDKAYYIVHFRFPPDEDTIKTVLDSGATWAQEINYNAAIVSATSSQSVLIHEINLVDWIGIYHPAYGLDYKIAGRSEPFSAADLSSLSIDPASVADENIANISVDFFDDVEAEDKRSTVESTGAVILGVGMNGFTLEKNSSILNALSAVPGVYQIALNERISLSLDRSRSISKVDAVNRMENLYFLSGVQGNGERLGVCDNGLDHSNPANLATLPQDIRNRVLAIVNISPLPIGAGDHGTHVSGTMMGDGSASEGKVKGMAPSAHLHAQVDIINSTENTLVTFLRAVRNQVSAISNSWGAFPAGPSNNLYGATARGIDRFAYIFPEFLIVFASGNDERDTGPGGGAVGAADGNMDADRLGQQTKAKNIITVGATENVRDNDGWANTYRTVYPTRYNHANFNVLAGGAADGYTFSDSANQLALFSNRGPVDSAPGVATGRTVPHIVAPGTNIIALKSSLQPKRNNWRDPTTVSDDIYTIKFGTSMAAPHVTGAAALCRQFYRTRFGNMRRPAILDTVALTSTPPENFVGFPAIVQVANRLICAWVRPESSVNDKKLVAAVFDAQMVRLHVNAIDLIEDVGEQATPRLAVNGNNLYLLHRHSNNELQLHKFVVDPVAPAIAIDPAWADNGAVVVATGIDTNPERQVALTFAENHLAIGWFASSQLNFRRYQEADGSAVDGSPVAVGAGTAGSDHNFMIHNGSKYAMVWLNNADVEFRSVDNSGNPEDTEPLTVLGGGSPRPPHLTWDNTNSRFIVIWDEVAAPREKIVARGVDANNALLPDLIDVIQTAENGHLRRPIIVAHPMQGFVLGWEDDAQQDQFDVYFTFLNTGLQTDERIPISAQDSEGRRLLFVSDTPQDTSGFSLFKYDEGLIVAWNSLDEVGADALTVAAVGIRPDGNFFAQTDPDNPLIAGSHYVNHAFSDNMIASLDHVSIVWAGGDSYHLAWTEPAAGLGSSRLVLRRTNPDGFVDTTYGAGGFQLVSNDVFDNRAALLWDGRFLFCITAGSNPTVRVYDNLGRPADGSNAPFPAFGGNGEFTINEFSLNDITPQLDTILPRPGPNQFRLIVLYGSGFLLPQTIRYAVLDHNSAYVNLTGGPAAGPIDLVSIANPGQLGTTRHGWFIHRENRATAYWHQRANPADPWEIHLSQSDTSVHPFVVSAPTPLIARVAGDTWEALNANIAYRQQGITGAGVGPIEYAVVWQHRPAAGQPFEIRFSRLQRNGAPQPATHNVQVVFPGMVDGSGTAIWPPAAGVDTHAIEPQIVCNHTYEDVSPPPAVGAPVGNVWAQWAPGYGLAWIGEPTSGTGKRSLFFTVLDENGVRLQIERPAPQARVIAGITKVSDDDADVKDFHLMWNGRSFRIGWTEERNGRLYHMQTGLTRHGSKNVYDQPSAALLKCALISGATNINNTALPNIPSAANINDGYGWGRLNVRQSLSPPPPATMHARDDASVGNGRTVTYRFQLPPQTALLRVTLSWTDPPGANVVNQLNLRVTASASGNIYRGNQWDVAGGNPHLSRAGAPAPDANQTIEQVVLANPPAGEYVVDVIGQTVTATANNGFPAQPFALTFIGSGPEDIFGGFGVCDRAFY